MFFNDFNTCWRILTEFSWFLEKKCVDFLPNLFWEKFLKISLESKWRAGFANFKQEKCWDFRELSWVWGYFKFSKFQKPRSSWNASKCTNFDRVYVSSLETGIVVKFRRKIEKVGKFYYGPNVGWIYQNMHLIEKIFTGSERPKSKVSEGCQGIKRTTL